MKISFEVCVDNPERTLGESSDLLFRLVDWFRDQGFTGVVARRVIYNIEGQRIGELNVGAIPPVPFPNPS